MLTSGITQQTYARTGTFKYRLAIPIRPFWDQPVWNLICNKLPVGPQGAKGTMFKGKRVNISLQQDSVTSGFVSRDCSSERDALAGQHEKQRLSIHLFHLIVFGSYPMPLAQFQLALKGHRCEEYTGHIPPPRFQCLMAAGEEQGRSKSHKKVQTAIKIISQLIFSRSPVSPSLLFKNVFILLLLPAQSIFSEQQINKAEPNLLAVCIFFEYRGRESLLWFLALWTFIHFKLFLHERVGLYNCGDIKYAAKCGFRYRNIQKHIDFFRPDIYMMHSKECVELHYHGICIEILNHEVMIWQASMVPLAPAGRFCNYITYSHVSQLKLVFAA